MVYADIRRVSLENGRQTTVLRSKMTIITVISVAVFGNFRDKADIIVQYYLVPLRFSTDRLLEIDTVFSC